MLQQLGAGFFSWFQENSQEKLDLEAVARVCAGNLVVTASTGTSGNANGWSSHPRYDSW